MSSSRSADTPHVAGFNPLRFGAASPYVRFLRGLGGRVLACGCLVGLYETYGGSVVATIDACGPECGHRLHEVVTLPQPAPAVPDASSRKM
jgi:hypothetical protein